MRFIDLFCGCGGLTLGLEKAGHKCVLGVDNDADAIATFKNNFPHAKTWSREIKKLSDRRLQSLKNVKMVVGGPPCQAFSTLGSLGRHKDKRGRLFLEFVRVVEVVNPKIILFENVPAIMAPGNKKVWKRIQYLFDDLGYELEARVMNSAAFGVAQNRLRCFIIGRNDGKEIVFPKASHGAGRKELVTVKDVFRPGLSRKSDVAAAQITCEEKKKRIVHIEEGRSIRYQHDEKMLPKKLRFDIDWDELPEGRLRQARLQRLNSKSQAPTIVTSPYQYFHPMKNRYLTAGEAAAIQSFPKSFIFEGRKQSKWRQIGNAVPPRLAYAIGKVLK